MPTIALYLSGDQAATDVRSCSNSAKSPGGGRCSALDVRDGRVSGGEEGAATACTLGMQAVFAGGDPAINSFINRGRASMGAARNAAIG
jgi:hypothetical protein